MSDPLQLLDVEPGETTRIRGTRVPNVGDEYIESYYQLLATAELKTAHFADDADELPDPPESDLPLVGIAPSSVDGIEYNTVYTYNDGEWIETLSQIAEKIHRLEEQVENIEDQLLDVQAVEVKHIDTRPANNREFDYTIEFDIGYCLVGNTVYMEAESTIQGATWSAELDTHTDGQSVEQTGRIDVRHNETIEITMYPDENKEEILYEAQYSDHTW